MKPATFITIKIVLTLVLLGCLFNWPYGYYQLVRFLGMVGFAVLAYHSYKMGRQGFFVIWLASAVLINPLVKISLGRELWNVVDVIWAVLLITSIIMESDKAVENETSFDNNPHN